MRIYSARFTFCFLLIFLFLHLNPLLAQAPHPADIFGFTPGDDYRLASYDQMLEYYRRLDAASNRVQMREIGRSTLGRPLLLLFISSEENLRNLERHRQTAEQLARARIDETTARELAASGKSIVWIDGGLHASEVAHGQMTTLLAYRVATEESKEMKKIRDNTILLLMPVMNPDGLEIIRDWYLAHRETPFETTRPPWLYHYYIGHDNNRDWFMNNMPESNAVTRVLYNEWYPQIVYNHHQTGPSWTRIFIPPFADPVNPNIHPGVTTGVNLVGSAMANRFAMEKMPGAVSGVIYSMWWNGGMRTVPYFHNMIGILTETSHATPTPRFYDPDSIPKNIAARRGGGHPTDGTNIFYPYPWKGGESSFSHPVAYMLTASMATLRTATDLREQWLYNIYRMGRDAIEKGESESPRSYVIPAGQWDAGEAHNLVNILQIGGIEIQRTKKPLTIRETTFPAGSFVIDAAQAFRPYLIDLMEKQVYPDRRTTPGGPPETPYDLAGWTLPMQMGVEIHRLDETVDADGEWVTGPVSVPAGEVADQARFGYRLSHKANSSIRAVNKLLSEEIAVYLDGAEGENKGDFIIEADNRKARQKVAQLAEELGLDFAGVAQRPNPLHRLEAPKIGLYKSWVANMDEGWTRWLLEEYAFHFDTLHDADIREGSLADYDAIILPDQSPQRLLNGHPAGTMPAPYTGGLGLEGALALKQYVEQGGTLVALDHASDFAIEQFGLPVRNAVAGLSSSQFFVPGSLLRLQVDNSHPLAFGMPSESVAFFTQSRAFETVRLDPKQEGGLTRIKEAPAPEVQVIARYAANDILMSGWAMGEKKYLGGKAALVRVPAGQGDVVLFGFRPQFRGQPRGTYKLLFNALLAATLEEMPGRAATETGIER